MIAWAANLGTLAFHAATVRRPDLDRPGRLPIDVDPRPGTGFPDAVRVAFELRGLLAEHGMTGFPQSLRRGPARTRADRAAARNGRRA